MKIQSFVFNPFQENTLVVYDDTREAVIIDPGCYEREERAELDEFIEEEKLTVKMVLNSHCHIDHILGNDYVKGKYKVDLMIHPIEEKVLLAVKSYASNYGFAAYREALPERFFQEGEQLRFGTTVFDILFLPGHSPGHVGFYNAAEKILIGGDVLFAGSIGRTDLPGGDFDTLISSIHKKLFTLPDAVVVYPGHGPTTTIGEEKVSNPYCALSPR